MSYATSAYSIIKFSIATLLMNEHNQKYHHTSDNIHLSSPLIGVINLTLWFAGFDSPSCSYPLPVSAPLLEREPGRMSLLGTRLRIGYILEELDRLKAIAVW